MKHPFAAQVPRGATARIRELPRELDGRALGEAHGSKAGKVHALLHAPCAVAALFDPDVWTCDRGGTDSLSTLASYGCDGARCPDLVWGVAPVKFQSTKGNATVHASPEIADRVDDYARFEGRASPAFVFLPTPTSLSDQLCHQPHSPMFLEVVKER